MTTQKRALLVVDDPVPKHGERAALKPDINPALVGSGELDLLCGSCGAVLAQSIWPNQLYDVGIICADCEAFNDTPSAIGGTVLGNVVYLPVGTYRIAGNIAIREGVLMIGEPVPGVGPPAAGNIIEFPH